MGWCGPWFTSSLLRDLGSFLLSIGNHSWVFFLIVGMSSDVKILRTSIFCCKDFKKPSIILREIVMSRWHVVENKGIYCLVFQCVVGLIVHSILYKVFHNKGFGEYLYYIINFVKSYCVSCLRKLWSYSTYLIGDGSVTLHVSSGFVSCIFVPL